MSKLHLSVRFRLLGLSLGLLVLFGSSSLLLGYLIERNQAEQQTQQAQYKKFEIIQATLAALHQYRHTGGEYASALMMKDDARKSATERAFEQARLDIDTQLIQVRAFDPASEQTIRTALAEVPEYSRRTAEAIANGKQAEAAPIFAELQRRLNLVETTLSAAASREHNLADEIQRRQLKRVETSKNFAIGIIACGGVAGLLLVLIVVRSIIRPLQMTTDAIRQVNAGRIEIDLPPITDDEFGQMAVALRQFRDGAEKLRRTAYQDPLTGLGNRAQMEEILQAAIDRCRENQRPLAVFFMDLDSFRSVNEKLGHKVGDRYLCEAANRLRRFVPEDAELFRYGGDKFVVVLESPAAGTSFDSQLRASADCMLRGVADPFPYGDQLLNMSISIGIAVYGHDGATVEHLLSSAEAALYAAKESGRNNARFAGTQLTGLIRQQMALANEIRRGIDREEFEVFYQPIVDVTQGRVFGAEALVRWHHPERGLLMPGAFIQIAEDEGLINSLGEQCLRAAHAQVIRWLDNGLELRIAVNLSARQIQASRALKPLIELHERNTFAASMIDLELTETVLFDSSEETRKVLDDIHRLGFKLGIDDFGTGYSSFSYLGRLPIDKIKIERQFVAEMLTSRSAMAIVSAMMALAHTLDLQIIAEGVETLEQSRELLRMGCTLQQGFYFSAALPVADFERWAATYENSLMKV